MGDGFLATERIPDRHFCDTMTSQEANAPSRSRMTPADLPAFLDSYKGGISVDEGLALNRYAADCAGGVIVEIGSFRGKSAVALATGAGISGEQVYCVDPHQEFTGVYGGKFGPQDRGAFYQVMLQTSLFDRVALVNLASKEAARGWHRPIGLLFIDGDHTYRGVSNDFKAWDPHVSMGGVVAFDDAIDPAIGPARLIEEILGSRRYMSLEVVGKIHFLRKLDPVPAQRSAAVKRILVVCHDLILAGGLIRFERFGRVARSRGHEVAFLRFAHSQSPMRSIEFPVLGFEEACALEWDVTMVPGAGFPLETIQRLSLLNEPWFGLRMQHILNDQTRRAGFVQVNEAFKPHVVVFNNREWPPGSFTKLQARRFHVLEGAVDAAAFTPRQYVQGSIAGRRFVLGGLANKNPAPLVEALRDLGEGYELRLFGHPGSLRETAVDLLQSGALQLVGPLGERELPAFYRDLDCVVHTETFAGWANLAAEALASGIPLICTRHGTGAFARNGETALVLADPTSREICASVKRLQSDDELRNQLRTNGRSAVSHYSWDSYTSDLLALMDNPDPSVHYCWAPDLGLHGKWPLRARLQGLDPILDTCAGQTVLDLGTADGLIAHAFLQRDVASLHGVDFDTTRIARARAICSTFPAAQFWRADLGDWDGFVNTLKGRGSSGYDIVLSLGIHQHLRLEGRLGCLLGSAALARGRLVIRTPEHLSEEDRIDELLKGQGFALESTVYDAMDAAMGPLRCYRRLSQ